MTNMVPLIYFKIYPQFELICLSYFAWGLIPQSLVSDSERGEPMKAPATVGNKEVSEAKAMAALKYHSECYFSSCFYGGCGYKNSFFFFVILLKTIYYICFFILKPNDIL